MSGDQLQVPIPLGPFDIEGKIAAGGMGEVWKGRHREQDVPVAVKVLTASDARHREYYRDFRREVEAVAAMNHPNIIMVLDYGSVSEEAEELSGGQFVAGSPYLVMEYASRGHLKNLRAPIAWKDIRRILLALLDALAHAHARGMIHRDLKPRNILLGSYEDDRPALKLTDFGIAHAARRGRPTFEEEPADGDQERPAGTPWYMAPEQFHGRWRDYGPWTDLYGLGIVTFELVCGYIPYDGDSFVDLALKHIRHDLPDFDPILPVPDGFDRWIHRLCRKNPLERFRYAADAAWALVQLGEPGEQATDGFATVQQDSAPPKSETYTLRLVSLDEIGPDTFAELDALPSVAQIPRDPDELEEFGNRPTAHADDAVLRTSGAENPIPPPSRSPTRRFASDVPPMPSDWRPARIETPPLRLVGAGLELFGLRSIPTIGRDGERDLLWSTLNGVRRTGRPRVALVQGATGAGKSRLLDWIATRAHELGAAAILRAEHDAVGGPNQGIPQMLAEHFRAVGLSGHALLDRVTSELATLGVSDAYECRALAQLIGHTQFSDDEQEWVHFESPQERHATVTRHLRRLARDRPIVVALDDLQWGSESLDFLTEIVAGDHGSVLPVVFVGSVRDDALEISDADRERLRSLLDSHRVTTMQVDPMTGDELRELIEAKLALDRRLVEKIIDRAAGNPLFANQLIADWIERGVLEVDERGFQLADGVELEIPDDLFSIWRERLERLAGPAGDDARQMLEIAAILGDDVDESRWRRACIHAGLDWRAEAVERAEERRLLVTTDSGWRFAHAIGRETLLRSTREEGRAASLHAACLKTYRAERQKASPESLELQAHHAAGAGDLDLAVALLTRAIEGHLGRGEGSRAESILDRRRGLLDQLGPGTDDQRWGVGLALRAEAGLIAGRLERAERWCNEAIERAERHGWLDVRASALTLSSRVVRRLGSLDVSAELARLALERYEETGETAGAVRARLARAAALQLSGSLIEARVEAEQALAAATDEGNEVQEAFALVALAEIDTARGELDQALQEATRAAELATRLGYGQLASRAGVVSAAAARRQGDFEQASEHAESAELALSFSEQLAFAARLEHIALALAERRFDVALERLASLDPEDASDAALALTHAAFALAAAAAEESEDDESYLARLEAGLEDTGLITPDIAEAAELTADLRIERGDSAGARRARQIALAQWSALGQFDRVRVLQKVNTRSPIPDS